MQEEKNNSTQNKNQNQNKSFFMGIISAIAILGIAGTAVFGILYFNKNNNLDNKIVDQNQDQAQDTTEPAVELTIADSDHVLGNRDGKVKIFEFSDFQCPYCAQFHKVMNQIVAEYPNDVAWIYKQFPIQSHPLGLPGAIATECAGDQGKFWEMSDIIFTNQQTLVAEDFAKFANELNLDVDAFNLCMSDNPHNDKIANDYQTGISSGVRGTPSSFVNGQIIPGALPYESMKSMIDEVLKSTK